MKYRKLDENYDYTFQHHINTPETVAQAVITRLNLWLGEWWLDEQEGTPWVEKVMGRTYYYDLEIKDRISNTPGVVKIVKYLSVIKDRTLIVNCTIETIYGTTTIII